MAIPANDQLFTRSIHSYDYSPSQLRTLASIYDAVFPALDDEEAQKLVEKSLTSHTQEVQCRFFLPHILQNIHAIFFIVCSSNGRTLKPCSRPPLPI